MAQLEASIGALHLEITTIESKDSQQLSVKGNTSTDDVFRVWHPQELARLTRFLTNHAPTGGFRQRFFLQLPYRCACGRTQTRNHILFGCSRYVHPCLLFHSHAAFSSHPSNFPLLLQWLHLNPDAFTFGDVPPDPT